MSNNLEFKNTRVILFHKHPISANLHFLSFPHGGVSAFKKLPTLSAIVDDTDDIDRFGITLHPAVVSAWAEKKLQLTSGSLRTEPEFHETIEVPNGHIQVFLTGIASDQALQETQAKNEVKLLGLLECIGMSPVEMLLLQRAYRVIMGG